MSERTNQPWHQVLFRRTAIARIRPGMMHISDGIIICTPITTIITTAKISTLGLDRGTG